MDAAAADPVMLAVEAAVDPASVEAAAALDPLPTPEQIAQAAAAASAQRPSSLKEESTAPNLKGLGKGLGGAGLGPKRKSKGGAGSTISAATAPAALAVRGAGRPGGSAARSAGANGSSTAAGTEATVVSGTVTPGRTASASSGGSRGLKVEGAQSFNLKLAGDTLEDAESSADDDEWESASTDEEAIRLALTEGLATLDKGQSKGAAAAAAKSSTVAATGNSGSVTWRDTLSDMFDSTAVMMCGGVLAVCVGSLLVLGGRSYFNNRI